MRKNVEATVNPCISIDHGEPCDLIIINKINNMALNIFFTVYTIFDCTIPIGIYNDMSSSIF